MDFTYLAGVALPSRSLPNLRKITVLSFPDEEFPRWWQRALNASTVHGAVNDALAAVSVDEIFEKPEPEFLPILWLQPVIRAFSIRTVAAE